MVGFVIVSHSKNLAESVVELTSMMAPDANIKAAGGMEDGGFCTSLEKISAAVEEVYTDDGVLILMDMGSAVMTTEMVIEMMPDRNIKMVDCPIVEGAVAGTVMAVGGMDMDMILDQLSDIGTENKF